MTEAIIGEQPIFNKSYHEITNFSYHEVPKPVKRGIKMKFEFEEQHDGCNDAVATLFVVLLARFKHYGMNLESQAPQQFPIPWRLVATDGEGSDKAAKGRSHQLGVCEIRSRNVTGLSIGQWSTRMFVTSIMSKSLRYRFCTYCPPGKALFTSRQVDVETKAEWRDTVFEAFGRGHNLPARPPTAGDRYRWSCLRRSAASRLTLGRRQPWRAPAATPSAATAVGGALAGGAKSPPLQTLAPPKRFAPCQPTAEWSEHLEKPKDELLSSMCPDSLNYRRSGRCRELDASGRKLNRYKHHICPQYLANFTDKSDSPCLEGYEHASKGFDLPVLHIRPTCIALKTGHTCNDNKCRWGQDHASICMANNEEVRDRSLKGENLSERRRLEKLKRTKENKRIDDERQERCAQRRREESQPNADRQSRMKRKREWDDNEMRHG
ncbi:hypothetical protein C7974DRAFT_95648 [Boeremia exigua]|uniref:uncharacterized protein n=1 Tax=Boeremia exigua TaxID=749465 RepID=UPI001E8D12CD|nr:uncharacterized protein C7974DRAFT_95648 [Boeremia exigua]KAH6642123.1 hypothetical protein C7974DRAFT_95648 [Boeremia exigua]